MELGPQDATSKAFKVTREILAESVLNNPDEPLPNAPVRRRDLAEMLHWAGDGLCQICFTPIDLTLPMHHPGRMQLDHIIPTSQGGTDALGNIQLTHGRCNNEKNDGYRRGYPSPELARELLAASVLRWHNPLLHLPDDIMWEYDRALPVAEKYVRAREAELLVTGGDSPRMPGLLKELDYGRRLLSSKMRRIEKLEQRLRELQAATPRSPSSRPMI